MTDLQKYKYATTVLAIVVIVLLIITITQARDTSVSDTFQTLNERLEDCKKGLAEWDAKYPKGSQLSDAARDDLSDVLKSCENKIEATQ